MCNILMAAPNYLLLVNMPYAAMNQQSHFLPWMVGWLKLERQTNSNEKGIRKKKT